MSDIGDRIRRRREASGLTLDQLAQRVGVGKSQLSRIETGVQTGKLATLRRIATALGFDPPSGFFAEPQEEEKPRGALSAAIGPRLRELREERELSRDALATAAGISSRMLAAVERGERTGTLDTLEALATALGVAPGVLILGQEPGPQRPSAPPTAVTLTLGAEELAAPVEAHARTLVPGLGACLGFEIRDGAVTVCFALPDAALEVE